MSSEESIKLENDDSSIYDELDSLISYKRRSNYFDWFDVENDEANIELDWISNKRMCYEYAISSYNNCDESPSENQYFPQNISAEKGYVSDILNSNTQIIPNTIEKSSPVAKPESECESIVSNNNLLISNVFACENVISSASEYKTKLMLDNCCYKGRLENIPIVSSRISNGLGYRHEKALHNNNNYYESRFTIRPNIFKRCTCLHDKLPCTNNKSFYYSILFHYLKGRNYLENYREEKLLQYSYNIKYELKYPVDPCDEIGLRNFEEKNNLGLNIFYMYNENKIELLRTTQYTNHKPQVEIINLLFHRSEKRIVHYYYIEYLKPIMNLYNKELKLKKTSQICKYCLKCFYKKKDYEDHLKSFLNL